MPEQPAFDFSHPYGPGEKFGDRIAALAARQDAGRLFRRLEADGFKFTLRDSDVVNVSPAPPVGVVAQLKAAKSGILWLLRERHP